jgi:hypothetical protein
MRLSLNRVTGEIQGHSIVLWGSMISGLETISIDGHEVSRRRSYRNTTNHDVSIPELGVTKVVVRLLPILSMKLYRSSELVATFGNPWAVPVQVGVGLVLAGIADRALRLAGL